MTIIYILLALGALAMLSDPPINVTDLFQSDEEAYANSSINPNSVNYYE